MQLTMAVEIGGIVANYLDGNISGEECSAQIVCGTAGVLAANMAFALGGPVAAVVTSLVVGEITRAVTKYQMERRLDKNARRNLSILLILRCKVWRSKSSGLMNTIKQKMHI